MNELQSDMIKKKSEKEKEIYLKNKISKILEKLKKKLIQKEKEENSSLYDNINNNKEIQEYGSPIKYNKNNSYSNLDIFNSSEVRFKGPFGYQNIIYKNNNPGPGQYEIFSNNSIYKKNENILEKNLFNSNTEIKYRKLYYEEIKNKNPPVGSYQSHYNTIGYRNFMIKNWVNYNPIKNGFL